MEDSPLSQFTSCQRQWKTLQQIFPGVGFIFDGRGRYVDVLSSGDGDQPPHCDPEALRGKTLHDVFPDDRAEHFLDCIRRALETGEVQTTEYRLDGRGGPRWFEAHLVPYSSADDDAGYVQAVTRDVTESRVRDRELERSERRFEAVFEDPNILVGLLEPDGTVIDINGTALEYLDVTLEAVTGEPFWETPWFTGDDALQAEVRELTARAAGGEYVEFELDLSTAVERELVIRGVFRPVTDDEGNVVSLVVSDRDITKRKRRERELHRNKRRFEAVFDDPHVLLGILDADGTVQRVNRTALDLVDADADEIRGEPFWETPWWSYSEELQTDLQRWLERAAAGDYVEFETEHYTVDGERVLVDGFLRPVVDDGEVVSIIASSHDVTSRNRHQQRLQVLHRVLRHNLRNSLNTIQGYAEEIRARSGEAATEERIDDMMRTIEAEAAALAELVTKIQQFKRIEEAEVDRSVTVETLFAEAAAAVRAAEPSCTVETTVPCAELAVPQPVEIAVFEAVENALEHHDRETATPAVELSAEIDRNVVPPQVELNVEDDGPGIPRSESEPLEMGEESDLNHTSRIGLWLMKWSVQSQGGELSISGSSSRGTTVTITLPLERSHGAA